MPFIVRFPFCIYVTVYSQMLVAMYGLLQVIGEPAMAESVYLVVEKVTLVATDLALTVQDFDPSATVLVAASAQDAVLALQGQDSVRVAFVHCTPTGFGETALGIALANRGSECVFMGDAAEHTVTSAQVLQSPFDERIVGQMLEKVSTLMAEKRRACSDATGA